MARRAAIGLDLGLSDDDAEPDSPLSASRQSTRKPKRKEESVNDLLTSSKDSTMLFGSRGPPKPNRSLGGQLSRKGSAGSIGGDPLDLLAKQVSQRRHEELTPQVDDEELQFQLALQKELGLAGLSGTSTPATQSAAVPAHVQPSVGLADSLMSRISTDSGVPGAKPQPEGEDAWDESLDNIMGDILGDDEKPKPKAKSEVIPTASVEVSSIYPTDTSQSGMQSTESGGLFDVQLDVGAKPRKRLGKATPSTPKEIPRSPSPVREERRDTGGDDSDWDNSMDNIMGDILDDMADGPSKKLPARTALEPVAEARTVAAVVTPDQCALPAKSDDVSMDLFRSQGGASCAKSHDSAASEKYGEDSDWDDASRDNFDHETAPAAINNEGVADGQQGGLEATSSMDNSQVGNLQASGCDGMPSPTLEDDPFRPPSKTPSVNTEGASSSLLDVELSVGPKTKKRLSKAKAKPPPTAPIGEHAQAQVPPIPPAVEEKQTPPSSPPPRDVSLPDSTFVGGDSQRDAPAESLGASLSGDVEESVPAELLFNGDDEKQGSQQLGIRQKPEANNTICVELEVGTKPKRRLGKPKPKPTPAQTAQEELKAEAQVSLQSAFTDGVADGQQGGLEATSSMDNSQVGNLQASGCDGMPSPTLEDDPFRPPSKTPSANTEGASSSLLDVELSVGPKTKKRLSKAKAKPPPTAPIGEHAQAQVPPIPPAVEEKQTPPSSPPPRDASPLPSSAHSDAPRVHLSDAGEASAMLQLHQGREEPADGAPISLDAVGHPPPTPPEQVHDDPPETSGLLMRHLDSEGVMQKPDAGLVQDVISNATKHARENSVVDVAEEDELPDPGFADSEDSMGLSKTWEGDMSVLQAELSLLDKVIPSTNHAPQSESALDLPTPASSSLGLGAKAASTSLSQEVAHQALVTDLPSSSPPVNAVLESVAPDAATAVLPAPGDVLVEATLPPASASPRFYESPLGGTAVPSSEPPPVSSGIPVAMTSPSVQLPHASIATLPLAQTDAKSSSPVSREQSKQAAFVDAPMAPATAAMLSNVSGELVQKTVASSPPAVGPPVVGSTPTVPTPSPSPEQIFHAAGDATSLRTDSARSAVAATAARVDISLEELANATVATVLSTQDLATSVSPSLQDLARAAAANILSSAGSANAGQRWPPRMRPPPLSLESPADIRPRAQLLSHHSSPPAPSQNDKSMEDHDLLQNTPTCVTTIQHVEVPSIPVISGAFGEASGILGHPTASTDQRSLPQAMSDLPPSSQWQTVPLSEQRCPFESDVPTTQLSALLSTAKASARPQGLTSAGSMEHSRTQNKQEQPAPTIGVSNLENEVAHLVASALPSLLEQLKEALEVDLVAKPAVIHVDAATETDNPNDEIKEFPQQPRVLSKPTIAICTSDSIRVSWSLSEDTPSIGGHAIAVTEGGGTTRYYDAESEMLVERLDDAKSLGRDVCCAVIKGVHAKQLIAAQVGLVCPEGGSFQFSPPSDAVTVDVPGAPSQPTVEVVNGMCLRVSWEAVPHKPDVNAYAVVVQDDDMLRYYDPVTRTLSPASNALRPLPAHVTSVTIRGLVCDVEYMAAVSSANDLGWSKYSRFSERISPRRPKPPTNVNIEAVSHASIRVSWSMPIGSKPPVTGFGVAILSCQQGSSAGILYYDAQSGGLVSEAARATPIPADTTHAVVPGVSPGTPYRAKVAAVNEAGWGVYGVFTESITILPPSAPERPKLDLVDATSIRVSWAPSKHLPAVTGFALAVQDHRLRYFDGRARVLTSSQADACTLPGEARSVLVRGLQRGSTCRAKLAAKNAVGWSRYSSFSPSLTMAVPEAIGPPTIDVLTATSLQVSWQVPLSASQPKIMGFAVAVHDQRKLRYLDPESGKLVAKGDQLRALPPETRSAVVMGLQIGSSYSAKVAVANAIGWSKYSAFSCDVVAKVPSMPCKPSACITSAKDVRVVWTPVRHAPKVTGYVITLCQAGLLLYLNWNTGALSADVRKAVPTPAEARSTLVHVHSNIQSAQVAVAAVNEVGWSDFSLLSNVVNFAAKGDFAEHWSHRIDLEPFIPQPRTLLTSRFHAVRTGNPPFLMHNLLNTSQSIIEDLLRSVGFVDAAELLQQRCMAGTGVEDALLNLWAGMEAIRPASKLWCELSRVLRVDDKEELQPWMPIVDALSEILMDKKPHSALTAWRGSQITSEQVTSIHSGEIIRPPTFIAASLDRSVAEVFRDTYMIRLSVPAGCHNAGLMRKIISDSEDTRTTEIIVLPYSALRVTAIKADKCFLYVDVLDGGSDFLQNEASSSACARVLPL